MMRQFELVERVKSYDPDADEDALNRAYVFSMKAHGTQKRASGDPYFSHPVEVAGILAEHEARRRVDRHRPAARHGRGHGRDARGDRAAVRPRDRAPGRRRHQALAPRAAVRPDQAGGEFPQAGARDVGGHPRAAGEAGRPAAQHAHAALHQGRRQAPRASRARRWRSTRRSPSASACTRCKDELEDLAFARAQSRRARGHHARLAFLREKGGDICRARHRASSTTTLREGGDRGAGLGPREDALFDLAQDAAQECRLRAALRHHGVPHRRRQRRAVLPRARRASTAAIRSCRAASRTTSRRRSRTTTARSTPA